MGMSSGGGKGGVSSDINVTPLIDVLLVLLIIFLVVMPIMMKMEMLEIPRKITDTEAPDPNATMLTIKVKVTGDMVFTDNDKETPINAADLLGLGDELRSLGDGLSRGISRQGDDGKQAAKTEQ